MPLEGQGKSTRNRAEGAAGNRAESAGKVGGVLAGLGFPAPISQQPGEFSSGNSTERKTNNSKRNRGGDTGIRGILC